MRINILTRYVGVSLILVALMMAVSGVVGVVYADDSVIPLFVASFLTLLVGLYPMIFVRSVDNITTKEGVAIVVLSWLFCCIFGMIPYICYGGEFSLVNALFESVSGFTTTGASILDDIEALPHGLLFWRASTAWVGGLGIVSIFSLVIPASMDRKSVLSNAELSDLAKSQSSRPGKHFIKTMLTVYVLLTVTCFVFLKMTGMGWFDAATNAMSTCSTCGFCVKNASIAAYDSLAAELIIAFYMTISSISFIQISSFVLGRWKNRRRLSAATCAFICFLAASSIAIAVNLTLKDGIDFFESLRVAVFQVCSITTTTGFATTDTNLWPPLCIVLLLVASVVCGCSGSTSGGVKMDRVVLLFSYIKSGSGKVVNPYLVSNTKIDGHFIDEDVATDTMKFVLLYVLLLVIGAVVNTMGGLDLETGLSASVACLGNVGPGFGDVGSTGNYADFPSALKVSSSFLMIAGRLEIIPLLSFVGLFFGKK